MKLFPPPLTVGDNEGFSKEKDIFNRQELGKGLMALVQNLETPLVIALDGAWGTGKSTFLKMWAGDLRKAGFSVISFDAFENDYVEDAFAVIAREIVSFAEIAAASHKSEVELLAKKAIKVSKILGTNALKVGVKLATFYAISSEDLKDVKDDIAQAASDITDGYLNELITSASQQKSEIESFKSALQALPDLLKQPTGARNPLVFVIDELDRCKPLFALQLLERVKHFFSVEGIHFVLGVNLEQLRNSVKLAYGAEIDAISYLQKFVTVTTTIVDTSMDVSNTVSAKYCAYLRKVMEFEGEGCQIAEDMAKQIRHIADIRGITLREIERIHCYLALAIAASANNSYRPFAIVGGLCLLKVLHPHLYLKARVGRLRYEDISKPLALEYTSRVDDETRLHVKNFWQFCTEEQCDKGILDNYGEGLRRYGIRSRTDIVPLIANRIVDRFVPMIEAR